MGVAELKPNLAEEVDVKLHEARRVLTRRAQEIEDLRDAAVLQIRKSPFQAVGIAVAAGMFLGLIAGVAVTYPRRKAA